jgi:beta-lactamase regulating signal transducer with metallopeptidase domain
MKTFIYLLQVSACTGIFYAFYFLLLRRLTFFTLNRWYLLCTLLFSLIIPTINIHVDTAQPAAILQPVMYVNQIQAADEPMMIQNISTLQKVKPAFDLLTPVKAIYVAIAGISVLHLLFTLIVFLRRRKAELLMQIGNVRILKGNSKQGNSSFLNVIFVNDNELEPAEIKQIIAHEMLHVKLLHSADRIIARLVQIVLWFNPFAYCYIRSIEENHEFEVDRIITGNADKSMYATLLFKLSISNQSYLMHSFSKVPLKSRIAMLFNKPTSNMKKMIYVLIAPVVLISCLAFANLKAKSTADTVKKHPFYTLTKSTTTDGVALDKAIADTAKYRQMVKQTPEQRIAEEKGKADYEAYKKTDDYKQKMDNSNYALGYTRTYKVTDYVEKGLPRFRKEGFILVTDNRKYFVETGYGQTKQLKHILKVGDEFDMKVIMSGLWVKDMYVAIEPAVITKKGKEIYRAAEASPIPKEAFLFEANHVRYTDGQVTNIKKYPNGKWKSAVVEVVNGYKIKFNIKPTAPDFTNIEWGDHVTFRFVHEVKTGKKEYVVNDWISLTTNIKDYGIKNPDFFYKFYEKI